MEPSNNGKPIDLSRWGFFLKFGQILTLIVGTAYFVIFIYQMRDAIKENIVANDVNQRQLLAKYEESIKVQRRIACLLKFHVYEGQKPYKGECDNGNGYY